MKNKLIKGLSLSVNPKHSISERFKASTRVFYHFLKKFESERNTPFSVILGFIPRIHAKHSSLDTRDRLSITPEYDHKRSLIKNLEYIETAESGVDKVVSSCEKNPNVHKTYMNFLRQRKTALDAPLHAVSSGRLLPQCTWEFY